MPSDKKLLEQAQSLLISSRQLPREASIPLEIRQLHGDASNRIYHRVTLNQSSYILMQRPQTSLESPSEEITKDPSHITEYSFLNIQRFLAESGIRVPKIFATSPKEDYILIEDCGDQTFEKEIKENPSYLLDNYKKAIDLLIQIQNLSKPPEAQNWIAWQRKFDCDLLEWEFDHFMEWGLEKGQNVTLPRAERKTLQSIFRDCTQEILSLPTCLCHRDFQSRNLLFFNNTLVLLDFQDALLGPLPYDLVALLRDSYVELSQDHLQSLQDYYMNQKGIENHSAFLRGFYIQTLQRKLKDTGRFHYIHLVKKNPNFLLSLPASLRYIRHALEYLSEGKHLIPIFKKYYPEVFS